MIIKIEQQEDVQRAFKRHLEAQKRKATGSDFSIDEPFQEQIIQHKIPQSLPLENENKARNDQIDIGTDLFKNQKRFQVQQSQVVNKRMGVTSTNLKKQTKGQKKPQKKPKLDLNCTLYSVESNKSQYELPKNNQHVRMDLQDSEYLKLYQQKDQMHNPDRERAQSICENIKYDPITARRNPFFNKNKKREPQIIYWENDLKEMQQTGLQKRKLSLPQTSDKLKHPLKQNPITSQQCTQQGSYKKPSDLSAQVKQIPQIFLKCLFSNKQQEMNKFVKENRLDQYDASDILSLYHRSKEEQWKQRRLSSYIDINLKLTRELSTQYLKDISKKFNISKEDMSSSLINSTASENALIQQQISRELNKVKRSIQGKRKTVSPHPYTSSDEVTAKSVKPRRNKFMRKEHSSDFKPALDSSLLGSNKGKQLSQKKFLLDLKRIVPNSDSLEQETTQLSTIQPIISQNRKDISDRTQHASHQHINSQKSEMESIKSKYLSFRDKAVDFGLQTERDRKSKKMLRDMEFNRSKQKQLKKRLMSDQFVAYGQQNNYENYHKTFESKVKVWQKNGIRDLDFNMQRLNLNALKMINSEAQL